MTPIMADVEVRLSAFEGSCSIEVLWAPTSAPPAMRLSTVSANFTPSFSAIGLALDHEGAADRVRAGIADHLVERRARSAR